MWHSAKCNLLWQLVRTASCWGFVYSRIAPFVMHSFGVGRLSPGLWVDRGVIYLAQTMNIELWSHMNFLLQDIASFEPTSTQSQSSHRYPDAPVAIQFDTRNTVVHKLLNILPPIGCNGFSMRNGKSHFKSLSTYKSTIRKGLYCYWTRASSLYVYVRVQHSIYTLPMAYLWSHAYDTQSTHKHTQHPHQLHR